MAKLLKTGLIVKIKGRYFTSSKGQVIYYFLSELQKMLQEEKILYQLHGIDVLLLEKYRNHRNSNNNNTKIHSNDTKERETIIQDILTEENNQQMKRILLSPKSFFL